MEKVIFDTNRLYNKQGSSFFAKNICKLDSFQECAEIIVPDMVIGELENKYKRDFEEEKNKFVKTILNTFLTHNADKCSPEERISQLKQNEIIKYSIIELKNNSVLSEIKNLALKKEAPFKENSKEDSGFKDAYIYFTILEYLQVCTDKYVFVCTEDERFKEALEKHSNIRVVKDFEEFREKSISSFNDEYFLSKLNEAINKDIKKENIVDFWLSINGNYILLVDIEDEEIVIEVEKREVVSWVSTSIYSDSLQSFINSNSFKNTHSIIKFVNRYSKYYSDSEILNLFESLLNNVYVKGAIGYGTAVKDFFASLYQAKKETLEVELRESLKSLIFNY